VTCDSDITFKVKRSRSPGSFTHRSVNAVCICSGERGNVLAVGTYCYFAVCTLQVRPAQRREALQGPPTEERAGGILWRPPTYSILYVFGFIFSVTPTKNVHNFILTFLMILIQHVLKLCPKITVPSSTTVTLVFKVLVPPL